MVKPPRNRNWIWFYAVVGILGVTAAVIPLIYNLRQQVKLPELHAARELWKQKGPRSYVLEYSKHGSTSGGLVVTVRDGQIESVMLKSSADQGDPGRPVEKRQLGYYDMIGLFDDIERFLEMDAEPNAPRAFNRAGFDPADGHLLYYLRSVAATGFRLEIRITKLEPL